ncbi:MAG TPA: HAD-IA family hydrolase [Allocoleopsis sp.]
MVKICCGTKVFENVQAIIFDKDGTLANAEVYLRNLAQRRARLIDAQIPGVQEPLLMAFGLNQARLHPSGLMAVGSRLENEIAAAAYVAETGREWIESLEIVRSAFSEADRYFANKAEQTPLIEGTLNLLQNLFQAGIKIGVLSSDSTVNVKNFIQYYQLDPYFQLYWGADGYTDKSAPDLLAKIWSELKVNPSQTLFVGDAAIDVKIARSQTASFLGFGGGWTTAVYLAEADIVATTWKEVEVIF